MTICVSSNQAIASHMQPATAVLIVLTADNVYYEESVESVVHRPAPTTYVTPQYRSAGVISSTISIKLKKVDEHSNFNLFKKQSFS